jgi:signal transduction histidine kinase
MRSRYPTGSMERTLISLRWAMFGAVAVLVSATGGLTPTGKLTLGALFLLQLAIALTHYYKIQFPRLLWTVIAVLDSILILPAYVSANGPVGPLFLLAGLYPVITISLCFGSIGGVLAGCLVAVMQAYGELFPVTDTSWIPASLSLLESPLLMILAAWLGNYVQRIDYKQALESRKQDEITLQEQDRLKTMVRSVYRMAGAITGSLEPLRILDTALNLAQEGSGEKGSASRLVSAALLRDEHEFFLATARRLTRADLRATFPGADGGLSRILHSRLPTRVDAPAQDAELSCLAALLSCHSGILLPLVVEEDVRGALLFAHPEPQFIEGDFLELIEGLSKQTAATLRNAELYQSLREERDRLVEVEEEARKKLARDLHDGPIQTTAAIAMRVNYARRLLQRQPEVTGTELFEIEELARRATKEMRHMLFTLRPLVLETNGINAALQQLSEKTRDLFNQEIILEVDPQAAARLDITRQGVLFNLVEEAVGNARKHAKAPHVWVRLRREADGLFLEVADDGVGFNVSEVEANYNERGSLGLVNLRERAELAGGTLQLTSTPGKGTRVQVRIPNAALPPVSSA